MLLTLRHALRSLRRSPGFLAVAVASLGIGLGLTTTMFAVLDALLNPAVPYPEPDRLYSVAWHVDTRHTGVTEGQAFRFIKDNARSFDAVVPTSWTFAMLAGGGGTTQEWIGEVTPSFFQAIDVPPVMGRTFTENDAPMQGAIVNETVFKRLYGHRRSLHGATISLDGQRRPILGVMPASLTEPGTILLQLPSSTDRGEGRIWRPLVRLRRGVTIEQAQAEMAMLARQLTDIHNARLVGPFDFSLVSVRPTSGFLRDIHKAMLGSALAVLLIACTNLANLMFVRGLVRRREVALRLALGANRRTVMMQLLTESLLIAGLGGLLGLLLSTWGGDILLSTIPRNLQWIGIISPQFSWRVFASAAAATILSAILFGLVPAIRVVRGVSLDEALKDGATATSRRLPRYSVLVVSELALALVVVMGSGLLLKNLRHTSEVSDNFDARRLLTGFVTVRRDSSRTAGDLDAIRASVLVRIRGIPGVADAALSASAVPPGRFVTAEMSDSVRAIPAIDYQVVSPSFLRTMNLRVVEGRDFEDGDVTYGAVILNAAAAAYFYPHGGAVGRMLKLGAPASDGPWVRIIGIARTATQGRPGLRMHVAYGGGGFYVVRPMGAQNQAKLLVRMTGESPATIGAVNSAIRGATGVTFGGVQPYLAYLDESLASMRYLVRLFVGMSVVALVLAAIGLYGTLAYTVTQRYREFAIRVAVGAQRADLLQVFAHDTAVMVLAGTALGAFAALAATPLLGDYLGDVRPSDVMTLITTELIILATATFAALGPARRALRVSPMDILRAI